MPEAHFLPWGEIDREYRIGRVRLEPWASARTNVPATARSALDQYFSRYLRNNGSPVTDVGITFIGSNPIEITSPAESTLLRRAIDAFTFASTLPQLLTIVRTKNTSFGLPRSERFQLITQVFQGNLNAVAVVSGGVMQAWTVSSIHFCMPWHVGGSMYQTDLDLLKALGLLLNGRRGSVLRERIFRALEWFRLAHTGSEDTSDQSRIVMMATAFEVLLEPPNPFQKRSAMAEKLTKLTHGLNLKTKQVAIASKTYTFTAPAVWLDDFYQLRNAIVHGDKIRPKRLRYPVTGRPWLTHLHVADLVMWEVILWELVAANLLGRNAVKLANTFARLANQPASPGFIREVTADTLGITDIHKDLRWT